MKLETLSEARYVGKSTMVSVNIPADLVAELAEKFDHSYEDALEIIASGVQNILDDGQYIENLFNY